MPILFSAIAHRTNMVVEFASCDGNFMEIIQQVISKIPTRDDKMTYYHGPYLIHFVMENQYLYFCITDKMCQRSRAFLFLNEIHRRFLAEGNDNFTKVLASQMYTYSEDYSTITIRKGEIEEINKIGVESSESILGEKVLFVNNPENISYATVSYVGKSPEQVSISMDKSRFYVVVIGVLILIIGLVYIFSPMSCIVVVGVIGCSYVKCFRNLDKNSE